MSVSKRFRFGFRYCLTIIVKFFPVLLESARISRPDRFKFNDTP